MTQASAKFIALAIVQKWYWQGCPVSGSLNGYRVIGTRTGRWRGQFDPQRAYNPGDMVANGNGDIFVSVEVNANEIEQRMVRLMHGPTFDEVPPDPPSPDILTDRETAAAIQRRLFDYAAADAELAVRFAVQPVLRERND